MLANKKPSNSHKKEECDVNSASPGPMESSQGEKTTRQGGEGGGEDLRSTERTGYLLAMSLVDLVENMTVKATRALQSTHTMKTEPVAIDPQNDDIEEDILTAPHHLLPKKKN